MSTYSAAKEAWLVSAQAQEKAWSDITDRRERYELLWSFFTGEPYTRALNLLNRGEYLKGIPKEACVEAMVTVAGREVTGKQIQLPPAVHSLVQRWVTIHELTIQAALNCDREAAHQALFLDAHVTDMYDIPSMLEDFLGALEPWMPRGWYQ